MQLTWPCQWALVLTVACTSGGGHRGRRDPPNDADSGLATTTCETPSTYYADADGDGYGDPGTEHESCTPALGDVPVAGDCDDTEPLAWEGALDEPCDGIDNDCDGTLPQCIRSLDRDAGASLDGWDGASGFIGQNAALLGDVNGDGLDDLGVMTAVGIDNTVTQVLSGAELPGFSGDIRKLGPISSLYNPYYPGGTGVLLLGAGDLDGDALGEIWVGTSPVFLIEGARLMAPVDLPGAARASIDFGTNTYVAEAGWGDGDGDGHADLLLSNQFDTYLFTGPFAGDYALDDAVLHLDSPWNGAYMSGIVQIRDMDGDGANELLLGTDCESDWGDGVDSDGPVPVVVAVDGTITGTYTLNYGRDQFDFWIDCEANPAHQYQFGAQAIGDIDGDGYEDLGTMDHTAFYLISGPHQGAIDPVADATLTWSTTLDTDYVVRPPQGVGDVDGDGLSETACLTKGEALDGRPDSEGELRIVRGGRSGHLGPEDTDAVWLSPPEDLWTGMTVRTGGDVDGDGWPDVLVAASSRYEAEQGEYFGNVYWLPGASLLAEP